MLQVLEGLAAPRDAASAHIAYGGYDDWRAREWREHDWHERGHWGDY